MEIRSTSADDPNSSPQRIDITRKNRDSIQSREPLNEKPEESRSPRDPLAAAKAVQEARDKYREKHQERIANARLDYTANHAEMFAAQIKSARDVYNARIAKALDRRAENALAADSPAASADKLEFSNASQILSQLDLAPSADDEARASRVAELKQLYENDALDSADLISRTAHRLLGGE